jgi:uncharacterized protein YcbX
MTTPHIASIYRYPVKGMTPERLASVGLAEGETLPFDRAYAIENGPGRFDPAKPKYLPKISFVMLMRDEKLAALDARFDDASETLTILRQGRQVAKGQLTTPAGRQMIEQFLAAFMDGKLRGAPRIVSAPGHSFSDVAAKCVHIVNLASVRDLERVIGRPVDPLRFRANVYVDGLAPWVEFGWLGKTLRIADAALTVFDRTQRCDATNVDPVTAQRDLAVPAALQRAYGHSDFGLYAKVTAAGDIATGDALITP